MISRLSELNSRDPSKPRRAEQMKRRYLMAMLLATAVGTGPAFAASVKDKLVSELKSQGFRNLSITRTWLGRTRITGSNGKFTRELVFNPYSGEILRDYWEEIKSDKEKAKSEKENAKNPQTGLLDPDDGEKEKTTFSGSNEENADSGDSNGGGDNGHSDGGGDGGDSDGGDSDGGGDGGKGDGHDG
ncbi:MAG: hypothetical protein Q9M41_01300 [Paracoccaceae bacterium]|nr:hypothetical protein [Paracoccaceae bacterium]